MNITSITWGDPPPAAIKKNTLFTETILGALHANPGRWACIKRGHPTASAARKMTADGPPWRIPSTDPKTHGAYVQVYRRVA
jgi:hypothetical protein